jgi:hypothetical protein
MGISISKKNLEVSCFEGLNVLPGEVEASPSLEVLFIEELEGEEI